VSETSLPNSTFPQECPWTLEQVLAPEAPQFSGKVRNLTGEHFWARGYAVSTVGFELEAVKKYIREQEQLDQDGRF
jgi:REP element-mobilizing transposase RayT